MSLLQTGPIGEIKIRSKFKEKELCTLTFLFPRYLSIEKAQKIVLEVTSGTLTDSPKSEWALTRQITKLGYDAHHHF